MIFTTLINALGIWLMLIIVITEIKTTKNTFWISWASTMIILNIISLTYNLLTLK